MQRISFAVSTLSAIVVLGGIATTAQGDTLWDQSTIDVAFGNAGIDQIFPDFPAEVYMVNDVTFTSNVIVTDVITYFTPFTGTSPGASFPARLSFFPKTGALPAGADTPGAQGEFTATFTDTGNLNGVAGLGNIHELQITGLNLPISAGDYWVGLTPKVDFDPHGQAFHLKSLSSVGDVSAWRDVTNAVLGTTDWVTVNSQITNFNDGAIKILGTAAVPEPGSMALLVGSALTMTFAMRRRRGN